MRFAPYRLSEVLHPENNNFDLIRLIAALAVMFGHAPGLSSAHGRADPVGAFLGIEYAGSLGVYAFFLLSGMLVTASYNRQNSTVSYMALRITRLWPGLVLNILISAFVIGPIFTSLSLSDYFHHPSLKLFVVHNLVLLNGPWMSLPVFEHSTAANAVNYTIWTLPIEFLCYVMVLIIGSAYLLRRPLFGLLASIGVFGLFMLGTICPPSLPIFTNMFKIMGGYSFYPAPFFILGMALYCVREYVVLDWRIAIALVAAYLATRGHLIGAPLLYVAYAYGVLTLAALPALHRFRPANDYSYGIYIYGFVCQQIVATTFPALGADESLMLSIPITLAFAAMSWHLVEKPSLGFCRRKIKCNPYLSEKALAKPT